MCILTALKSAIQIIDHDRLNLSFGTFFKILFGPNIYKAYYQEFKYLPLSTQKMPLQPNLAARKIFLQLVNKDLNGGFLQFIYLVVGHYDT